MAEPVQVLLPAPLLRLFPGAPKQVAVQAATVRDAIAQLDVRWPGMRDRLCDGKPALRRHLNVFVDGEKARLCTPLRPGTEMVVMTAMSGG